MAKKQKMIPLKELNLTDRFLFDEVMEDPAAHSIRMDVFSIDKESVVYNTEMQQQKRADLSKRSRYYQSMTDNTCWNLVFRIIIY